MKILFITDLYPPYYGGGYELRCRDVAEQLSHRGHTVFILTTKYEINKEKIEGKVFRLLEYYGWEMINRQRSFLLAQLKRVVLLRKNYWITQKIIKKVMPDIVYVWQLKSASILPVFAVQKRSIPCVFDIEDYWLKECRDYYDVKNNFFRRILRFILTGVWDLSKLNFNNMCFISDAVKQRYITEGFRDVNFRVIHKGVDTSHNDDESTHRSKDISCVHLLYAGRLAEEKGVNIAIESIAYLMCELKGRKIILDIIGAGGESYIEKLKKVVKSMNLEGVVKFISQCSQSDLFQRFKNYDVLLVPSVWEEPSGGIIVEAMIHGLPVIAARTGGIPEFIEDEITGILVPPGNSKEMAEAIKKLIENPTLYEQISINGIREVKEKYSHGKITGQIETYLSNVLKKAN